MWSDLTLGPSFKVKRGQPKLKVLITRLLLVLEVCNVKSTNGKSWAGNLLMWSNLTLDPSFKVERWLIGGYILQWFSDALGLVLYVFYVKLCP